MALRIKMVLLIAAAMTISLASVEAERNESHDSRHHVLIINSYHEQFRWTDNQVAGAREVLTENIDNLELYVEYMDTKRIYTKEYLTQLVNIYHLKYDNIKLDAIITTDDNALHFVMDHHQDLFQNVPVAFCGINDYAGFSFTGKDQFTGLVEVLDIEATIELALKFHPATGRVYVVVDSTPTGVGQLADVTAAAAKYPKLKFEYLKGQDYSTPELLRKLSILPEDSIVLLTVWLRDRNNDYAPTDEVGPLISNRSTVPVYGIIDMYLGYGIVGGKLLNSKTHGRLAAERIVRILNGQKPSSIPTLVGSRNPYMFDETQLRRWNTDPDDLPEGSIVINRSFSLYQTYRIQIWSIVAAFAFLLVAVAFLIVNIIMRRKAEIAMQESETRYRELIDKMSSGVAVYEAVENGSDFIFKDLNRAGERIDRTKKEDVVGKKVTEMFPGINQFGLLDVFRRVYKTGQPQHHPVRIYKDERYSAWFDNYVYKLPSGEIVAVHDDVTDQKNAEQQREKLFATVEAQNQQLIASAQQLRASNQQTNALNQQLMASQQELKLKNEELQSIVYISSHDLKTPLININGFSEILNEHCGEMKGLIEKCEVDADTTKEISSLLNNDIPTDLNYISTSTQRMQRLIEGLLHVSRIGTVEIKTQNIDMNDVVSDIIDTVKYKTEELNAEIVLGNLPDCTGDKHQITQVFTNLIDNALNYLSPKRKGRIDITGKTENNESIYCVEDNGIGIKPEYHGKVFEIYHRLNPQNSTEGDGLGLTIVRRILDRHKGRIWLESEPDKGTKFFVVMPTKK